MKDFAAYDDIIRLRNKALPGFNERQERAANAIARIIRKSQVDTVWDLGCGTGEIIGKLAETIPDKIFNGIDISQKSIEQANKNFSSLTNLEFRPGTLGSIRIKDPKHEIVIAVGNTMIHFGVNAFSKWLSKMKKSGKLPRYFFLDFIADWDQIMSKGNSFKIIDCHKRNPFFISGMNTVIFGDKIVRELIIIEAKQNACQSHVVGVEQFADSTTAYFAALKKHGYELAKQASYEHGYGLMEGSLWLMKII